MRGKALNLHDVWLVQAFQHGKVDVCEGIMVFDTEKEAREYARNWASDIPYNSNTEHESVIFRAVRSYRGRKNTPVVHHVAESPLHGGGK